MIELEWKVEYVMSDVSFEIINDCNEINNCIIVFQQT